MSLDRIKAMPVADLAAKNAHLWLWVTNATLRDGYDVMEAWGFTPRSPLTWIKPRITLGVYLRNATDISFSEHEVAHRSSTRANRRGCSRRCRSTRTSLRTVRSH